MYRNCAYRYVDSINWVVEIITGDVSIIITGVPEHGRTIFHRQNCQTFPLSLPLPLVQSQNPPSRKIRETVVLSHSSLSTKGKEGAQLHGRDSENTLEKRIGYPKISRWTRSINPWLRVAGITPYARGPRGSRATTEGGFREVESTWTDSFHGGLL